MGTALVLHTDAPAHDAAEAAFAEVARIELLVSTWRSDSELARVNGTPVGETASVSAELSSLLDEVFRLSRTTGGTFNPTVRPLIDAWKTREEGALPTRAAVDEALARVRLDGVSIDRGRGRRTADVIIEEGGFAKGYALDRAASVLRERRVRGVLDFGGQLATIGVAAPAAIGAPDRREVAALHLTLPADSSLSTSSGSERTFTVEGRTFTHLLDPRTGEALPPRGSISVIDHSALRADVLSTALYVMGPRDGWTFAQAHEIAAVFIVPVGSRWIVLPTSALKRLPIDLESVEQNYKVKE